MRSDIHDACSMHPAVMTHAEDKVQIKWHIWETAELAHEMSFIYGRNGCNVLPRVHNK